MVVTRSATKRLHPSESPIKSPKIRRTATDSIKRKPCRRNLNFEFDSVAGVDTITPPPSPEPETSSDPFTNSFTNSSTNSSTRCDPISEAKKLLSIGAVDGIVGRDKETSDLYNFIDKCLFTKESSTIFVCGPPGTGKTLSVNTILWRLSQHYQITQLFYNSLDFKKGSTIYTKIADDLKISVKDKTRYREKLIDFIEKFIIKSEKMVVLTIDEIDKLDKDLVDAMMDWPKARKSKLIFIGIANTITSTSLTKMNSFETNYVKKIAFRPYTKDQIVEIIQSRLKHVTKSYEIISKPALELCARKVSTYSGDARRALDIVRQAIENAEREKFYSYPSGLSCTSDDGNNFGSPRKILRMLPRVSPRRSPRKYALSLDRPLVEPRHIITILDSVFGSKLYEESSVTELTIQQQIILCCILCYGREKRNKEMAIPSLYKLFIKACTKTGTTSAKMSTPDFLCITQILESRGLVRVKQARELRLTKIALAVHEDEVAQRLSETSIIQNLMKQINSLL